MITVNILLLLKYILVRLKQDFENFHNFEIISLLTYLTQSFYTNKNVNIHTILVSGLLIFKPVKKNNNCSRKNKNKLYNKQELRQTNY